MKQPERSETKVRLDQDLYEALRDAAHESRLSQQQIIIEGLRMRLNVPPPNHQLADLSTIGADVPQDIIPYVRNFALWLMEEPLSEKEREMKNAFMKIFEPKGKRKRA